MTPASLPSGLYDLLLTERLERLLAADATARHQVLPLAGDAAERVADHLLQRAGRPARGVARRRCRGGTAPTVPRQRAAGVAAPATAGERGPRRGGPCRPARAAGPRLLRAVHRSPVGPTPPELGLAMPWLFTAGKGSPSLLQETPPRDWRRADQRRHPGQLHHGVGRAQAAGRAAADHRPRWRRRRKRRPRIRILTTTYTGATEARALDDLARLPGCEVRVSLDGRRTRLHAKAWLFHRKTGFGSRLRRQRQPVGRRADGWTGVDGQAHPARAGSPVRPRRRALRDAVGRQRVPALRPRQRRAPAVRWRRRSGASRFRRWRCVGMSSPASSTCSPRPISRTCWSSWRRSAPTAAAATCVVAATGTGKTVVAAFDYRNTCRRTGGRPRLLFVAHREEILRQALRTYREVLRDPEFGELLAGGREPERQDHLFATIDSVTSRDLVATVGADHWHTVVVDECHRLAADRFDAFVDSRAPEPPAGPDRNAGAQRRAAASPSTSIPGPTAARPWNCACGMRWTCSCWRRSSTTPATTRPTSQPVPWDQARRARRHRQAGHRQRRAARGWWSMNGGAWLRTRGESRALVFCVSVAHAEFMTDLAQPGRVAGGLCGRHHAVRGAPPRAAAPAQRRTVRAGDGGPRTTRASTCRWSTRCCCCGRRRARCCSSSRSAAACVWRRARRAAWCWTSSGSTAPSSASTACCRA
ncbi:MAG: DEAD/DEAH box helicase family protein [Comamonadaceae bacterium]|nr:DEAD/DEAH box helicase family protein [Comamonadaceae bacterium]